VRREKLLAAGYVDVGLDHFARPDDELAMAKRNRALHRNFQGFSLRPGASLYGWGISSISETDEIYRQSPSRSCSIERRWAQARSRSRGDID